MIDDAKLTFMCHALAYGGGYCAIAPTSDPKNNKICKQYAYF